MKTSEKPIKISNSDLNYNKKYAIELVNVKASASISKVNIKENRDSGIIIT